MMSSNSAVVPEFGTSSVAVYGRFLYKQTRSQHVYVFRPSMKKSFYTLSVMMNGQTIHPSLHSQFLRLSIWLMEDFVFHYLFIKQMMD